MRYAEIVERDKGLYVAVHFKPETIAKIKAFQARHAIPNPVPPEDLHATVVASRKAIDWSPMTAIKARATPMVPETWEKSNDKRFLVIPLDSDFLQNRHTLARELGATHDFTDFRPHVTVSYDIGDQELYLPRPEFEIIFDHEYQDDFDK